MDDLTSRSEWIIATLGDLTIEVSKVSLSPTNKKSGRRKIWRVNQTIFVHIKSSSDSVWLRFMVPQGFETDLASMPVISQILLGNRDDYLISSLVHDVLCVEKQPQFMTNAIMRIVMMADEVPTWKRVVIFYTLMAVGYGSPPMRLYNWIVSKLKGQK